MNGTKLTIAGFTIAAFVIGIIVGRVIKFPPACVDQPPSTPIVVNFDSYVPPTLSGFYNAVAVGPTTNAVYRRNMVLVGANGQCSVPPQLANVGGNWCPGDPCSQGNFKSPQPLMGQQVTQRVGFRNYSALKQALDSVSSTPTAPSP
jgi:hypothetical protein